MARTYKRDSNGRFAGGGGGSSGGGSKRPAAKTVSRGVNRLTRDNAGKITSVGGTGATARGGRLRTSSGSKRATVTAKASGAAPKGTISKTKRNKPATAANSIRPIARSKPAASKIVPITRKKKPTIKEKAKEVKGLMRKMGRSQTREALSSSNLDREIARQSGATKVARTTVQRRQQRAFNVQNGRNPRIGSKALYVYQSQLKELGSTSNKRVPFRRKPMTEAQAKKAASARNAADQKRLLKAINADTESRMTRAPKPKRKRKP